MTDIKLIPDQKVLEERFANKQLLVDNKHIADVLFEDAVCLTANVSLDVDFNTKWNLQQQYKKEHPDALIYLVDKHTPLALNYRHYFHYFSNGILVHRFLKGRTKYLKNIKNMLAYHGYKIKKIYGPKNSLEERAYRDVFLSIETKIKNTYVAKAQLAIKEMPSMDEFVKQCFSKNNVLLTATNEEHFPAECREFLAVFSSGDIYVSDEYKGPASFRGVIPVYRFMDTFKTLVYKDPVFIPQKYIRALYEKAESFDWFVPEDMLKQQSITSSKKQKMLKFIDNLFIKSKCLCTVNPRVAYNEAVLESGSDTSPEYKRYALFDDGTLLLSKDKYGPHYENSLLLKSLHKCFPEMNFKIDFVPDYYITEILNQLPQRQKKAADIYIDLLKRKAKKLQKLYNIKYFEALNLVAKLGGWKNWKSIDNISEEQSRHLIVQEQDYAYMARNKSASWGSPRIIAILKSMNVQYSCSWPSENTPKTNS